MVQFLFLHEPIANELTDCTQPVLLADSGFHFYMHTSIIVTQFCELPGINKQTGLLPISVSMYTHMYKHFLCCFRLLLKGQDDCRFQCVVAKLKLHFPPRPKVAILFQNKQLAQSAAKGQIRTKASVSVIQELTINLEQTNRQFVCQVYTDPDKY